MNPEAGPDLAMPDIEEGEPLPVLMPEPGFEFHEYRFFTTVFLSFPDGSLF